MVDSEQRAHDLAILYMQMEIKEDRLVAHFDDLEEFANHYKHLVDQFREQVP